MSNLNKLNLAERLLISGHVLASISMALISIGALLRKSELPEEPLFSSNGNNGGSTLKDINRNNNNSNYWSK